jgi:hypothetical protein
MIEDFEKMNKTVFLRNMDNLQHPALQFKHDENKIFSVHQKKYTDDKLK